MSRINDVGGMQGFPDLAHEVRGEVEYPVPPLSDPEALALFPTRSRLDADPVSAILCRRLDNLPLALELAAARTAVLSPAQILDRLSQRLDLLRGGRGADAKQRTLRSTIEWSCDLWLSGRSGYLAGSVFSPEAARSRAPRRLRAPTSTCWSRWSTRVWPMRSASWQ
jgi:hypothetical protein